MMIVVAIVALLSAAMALFMTYQIAYETGRDGRSVAECAAAIVHLLLCVGGLVAIAVFVLLGECP